jgi:hypothetical protein
LAVEGLRDRRSVALPTGTLDVAVSPGDWPLDALCGFGARRNPRRGFLVVSKVLGRHVPARPSAMRAAMNALAGRLPELQGPLVVLGLAETAICLAQGVHEAIVRAGHEDALFLHSTRQQIDSPLLCRFDEPHSHAPAHLVYRPENKGFDRPRTIVIVDDEVSTGTTIVNLARRVVAAWPSIERIVVATLADWSKDGSWIAQMPRPARCVSLIRGQLEWRAAAPMESAEIAVGALGRMSAHHNFGRLGRRDVAAEPPLTTLPPLPPKSTLRVLGTGEFTYPPFRLAEHLEAAGHDVVVQATSRSPARIGGAIGQALSFLDHEGASVPHHLYNVDPQDGRTTLICHETPAGSIDPWLVDTLRAHCIAYGAG